MEKIILKKVKRPQIGQAMAVIKIDGTTYDRLNVVSDDTGISVKKLASMLLEIALDNVIVEEEENDN